jgi:alkanesulfonate monooxygenase SsuD/methylene tetrahydromethanopterin reductase-like flavin-dependent oxidoreductase (luciferase family)
MIPLQNVGTESDQDVYASGLRLAEIAVEHGFDSVWTFEHHFTDYIVSPDPVQLLTWIGARYPNVGLGTAVIVLPWHDPVRCAERLAQLDILSGGRLILGLGRGLSRHEYEGLRVDLDDSRGRFVAYAEMLLNGLESGYLEADNEYIRQPRREIRPRPPFSFRGRTYAAAMSPESIPIMAGLGVRIFVIPQKPWETVKEDFDRYRAAWADVHGAIVPPPAPLASGQVLVHKDAKQAEEMAMRYIGNYYRAVMEHYGFAQHAHEGVKGYEFYAKISNYIDRHGQDGAVEDYVRLHPYGTPDQVIEKLAYLKDYLGIIGFQGAFCFGGMTPEEGESNLRLFSREVLPVVKGWSTETVLPEEPAALAVAHG